MNVMDMGSWPAVAGGLSAVMIFGAFLACDALIERRRMRNRRAQLRSRLFK
jgi:hypothetical protein